MSLPEVYSYSDALDALTDFAQSWNAAGSQAILRRCIRQARDEIAAVHNASFLTKRDRVLLRAAQTTGTVTYDHTGGATCERQLTLTGDTWPSWAVDAAVRLDDMVCDIQAVKSSTVVQLEAVMNPGQDVAAGTSYTLYPRHYALQPDFMKILSVAEESSWMLGDYVSASEYFALDRYNSETGDPRQYTIAQIPDQLGRMGLFVFPPSDTTEPLDLLYKRKLRDLRYSGHTSAEYAGTIVVTAGSAAVAGTSTQFDSKMVGSLLRISSSTTRPGGLESDNPWVEQRVIDTITNATTLTLDGNVATTRSGVSYVISDPVDLDSIFWNAFLACCQKQYAVARDLKNKAEVIAAYREALLIAKGGDSRTGQRQICRVGGVYATRITESTSRPEVA